MASGNKSVGLQITLAMFAMLAVLGWVLFYMQFRELDEQTAKHQKAQEELKNEQNVTRDQDAQMQQLIAVIGHPNLDVGGVTDDAPGTVLGNANLDLNKVRLLSNRNFSSAIDNLLAQITSLEAQVQQQANDNDAGIKNAAGLERKYQLDVDASLSAKNTAVKDKLAAIESKAEAVQAKQILLEEVQRSYNELQVEYDDAKAAWDDEKEIMDIKMAQLNRQVDNLRVKLKNATRVSFERADGLVRWVDNTAGMVWVNLGSDDGLRIKTTFSVYKKDHHGVGRRGAEDIKGQIEVTRILDGHSAEARILNDSLYDPVAKGDPIYTPLWSPGRTETFAIVGVIDLDQDGILDRARFHDLVSDAGATLNHEIDDDGKRVRYTKFPNEWVEWNEGDPELPSKTKYLIVADIPDPALAVLEADKEKRLRISARLDQMRDEARRLGIEEINLNDFLAFIGYRPQRRLYIPGVAERPFNLRSGAASVTTNEAVGNRSTANPVSGLFGPARRLKPKTSSGQTSRLYGGGAK
jgi:hypothetical protein